MIRHHLKVYDQTKKKSENQMIYRIKIQNTSKASSSKTDVFHKSGIYHSIILFVPLFHCRLLCKHIPSHHHHPFTSQQYGIERGLRWALTAPPLCRHA